MQARFDGRPAATVAGWLLVVGFELGTGLGSGLGSGLRSGFGQVGAAGPELKVRSGRSIVVDGVVRGGAVVGDLDLLDNGQRVTGAASRVAEEEVQLVFVIDALNGTLDEVTRTEDALERWLRGQGTSLRHPTSILVVDASGGRASVSRTPATQDPVGLLAALAAYRPGMPRIFEAQGALGEGDRVRLSLGAMSAIATAAADTPWPKVVIWIGQGWPYQVESSAKSSEQMFDSVVYFSDLLRSARMIVSVVSPAGVGGGQFPQQTFAGARDRSNVGSIAGPRVQVAAGDDYYRGFLKGVKGPKQADPNDLALQVLAIQSGGLVLQHNNNLEAQIGRCVGDADGLVTLSLEPEAGMGVVKYHALASKSMRTRTGYYSR